MFGAKHNLTRLTRIRPTLEALEDRCLLSGNVLQTNLVSDLPGVAQVMDKNLVNPWGISENAMSPFWVADNNAGMSTLYNSAGAPQALAVSIPSPGNLLGSDGTPTGTVFNIAPAASKAFMITDGTNTASAVFLFATEDGTIVGWNPGVDPTGTFDGPKGAGTKGASTHAVIAVDNSAIPTADNGAVYKGLAIATDANGRTLLYASNFRSGQVDVFDSNFKPVTNLPAGAFTDKKIPQGFAPFNVQTLGNQIYVTYAKQNADKHDDVAAPGNGFIDVFNLDGSGGHRLVTRGPLDSPWGLAIAPASFGSLAGDLLVGNFGNGRINVFDPGSGGALTALKDPDGQLIQIDGLWALKVGNGGNGGDAMTAYFTAGIDHEQHGLFGSLTPVAQGTPEGPAEAQMVQIAVDVFQANLATLNQDISSGAPQATLTQDIQALNASFIDLLRAKVRFAGDTHDDFILHKPEVTATENLIDAALAAFFAFSGKQG
jgi:uncharacterized protein (TIGR03118 family)